MPRLLPRDFTLVKANGRVSLSGHHRRRPSPRRSPRWPRCAGSEWSLRYAFVLFVIATVCAIRLPAEVDSSEGEGQMVLRGARRAARRGAAGGARGSPARSRSRCAPTAGPLVPQRVPADVRGVPAARPRRAARTARSARGDDRHRGRRRRPGQRVIGILAASMLQADHPGHGRRAGAGRRRAAALAGRAVLRRLDAGAARAGGRAGAGAREGLPRRHHPARHPHAGAGERVRAAATPPASWRG